MKELSDLRKQLGVMGGVGAAAFGDQFGVGRDVEQFVARMSAATCGSGGAIPRAAPGFRFAHPGYRAEGGVPSGSPLARSAACLNAPAPGAFSIHRNSSCLAADQVRGRLLRDAARELI